MKRLNDLEFKNKRQEYLEDIVLDYDDIIAIEEARRDKKENRLVSLEEVEKELRIK